MAAEMAELERALVVKLRAAEQRASTAERQASVLEAKERRAAQQKRQKTMLAFASQSRDLPTRPAHFDTDVSNATCAC